MFQYIFAGTTYAGILPQINTNVYVVYCWRSYIHWWIYTGQYQCICCMFHYIFAGTSDTGNFTQINSSVHVVCFIILLKVHTLLKGIHIGEFTQVNTNVYVVCFNISLQNLHILVTLHKSITVYMLYVSLYCGRNYTHWWIYTSQYQSICCMFQYIVEGTTHIGGFTQVNTSLYVVCFNILLKELHTLVNLHKAIPVYMLYVSIYLCRNYTHW